MVIKLTSKVHTLVCGEFREMMLDHARGVGVTRMDLKSLGRGRDESGGNGDGGGKRKMKIKDPDESFKPASTDTRLGAEARPTFVIEVALGRRGGENMERLRADARYWLLETDREVRLVLLIHVGRVEKVIELERWELRQKDLQSDSTEGQDALEPTCAQAIRLDDTHEDSLPSVTGGL